MLKTHFLPLLSAYINASLMLFRGLIYKGLLWNVKARWNVDDLYTHWHARQEFITRVKWNDTALTTCLVTLSANLVFFPHKIEWVQLSLLVGHMAWHAIADHFCCVAPVDFVRECIIGTGLNYKGRRSVTESGVECQNWDLNTPHEHQ